MFSMPFRKGFQAAERPRQPPEKTRDRLKRPPVTTGFCPALPAFAPLEGGQGRKWAALAFTGLVRPALRPIEARARPLGIGIEGRGKGLVDDRSEVDFRRPPPLRASRARPWLPGSSARRSNSSTRAAGQNSTSTGTSRLASTGSSVTTQVWVTLACSLPVRCTAARSPAVEPIGEVEPVQRHQIRAGGRFVSSRPGGGGLSARAVLLISSTLIGRDRTRGQLRSVMPIVSQLRSRNGPWKSYLAGAKRCQALARQGGAPLPLDSARDAGLQPGTAVDRAASLR